MTNNKYSPAREPSSEPEKETRHSYSNLPCPSEKEFEIWSQEINLDPIEGPRLDDGCKVKNHRTQMAQILALAKRITIGFPKNWTPTVQSEIKNTYDYIRKNTNHLKIDLSQTQTVARNFRSEKKIELGGQFFKASPLEALSVLVHEARHSDTRDPGHVKCIIGDIPKTQGGCDDVFSNEADNAGAYAYGTLYELALGQYSADLDRAEKELMITNALTVLSTRFNVFKSVMAKHFDIVTVLLEDGSLAWVHPFSLEFITLNIELPKFQEKFKKIEFSPRTGSLLLFTESNRLFMWGPRHPAKRPVAEAMAEDDKFVHISRQYVPYDSSVTRYTTLKTNGQLEYIQYDANLNKYVISPYPLYSNPVDPNPVLPNLKFFLLAHGINSYFLDKQGLLTRAHQYGNEPNLIQDPNSQSESGGWKTATGGVFYNDLILTDADGKLVNLKMNFINDNGADEINFRKEPFILQPDKPAKKYLQGLQFHAVLDEEGGLLISNYREKDRNHFLKNTNKKIIDFVITRLTFAESSLYRPADFNDSLLRKCNIKKVVSTVGYGSVIGLNNDLRLVAASSDERCTLLLKEKKWTHAELEGYDDHSPDQAERRPFPDVYLKLSSQTEQHNWKPYTRSSLDQSK